MDKRIELFFEREKYRADFEGFCRDILGYKDMNSIHSSLCSFLLAKHKRKLILMPRFTFKSCIVTIGYSLWRLSKDYNLRILIYSDALNKAKGFLNSITNHVTGKVEGSRFREIFGHWEVDPKKDKWNQEQIVIAFRGNAQAEPSVDTGGQDSSKIGFHYDLIIFDDIVSDQNVTTKAQMDKTVDCYKKSLSLLKPGGDTIIVGCLVTGSKVTMDDGTLRAIEKVKVGEKVISHKYDREHSVETVEAMIPQGTADVYEVKTPNRTIQATGNHPFLTPEGFKRVDELKEGSQVYTLSYLPRLKKTEHTLEDIWILGFMFGDGWITKRKDRTGLVVCFAKGIDEKLNNKVLDFFENKFQTKLKLTKGGYYRTEKQSIGKYLVGLGFYGKAKTKRIPKYIFSLSNANRESFLNGFISADGWVDKLKHIEICNKPLIEDLKHLAEICGYKVSNIHSRTRISQPPNSPEPIVAESHHISIGNKKRFKRFRLERIKSIKPIGKKEVFDLTVSNTHNFIAEGLVVHNTRWHFGDLYGRLLAENDSGLFQTFIEKAEENGKLFFDNIGECSLTHERLALLKKQQGSYVFSCLYNNSPVDDETATFKTGDFSFFNARGEDLYITATIDPAGEGEDMTAITVVGTDHKMNMYLLDLVNEKLSPSEMIGKVINLHHKYKFKQFGIETNFFRGMLKMELEKRVMEEHRENPSAFPLFGTVEFKPSARKGENKHSRIRGLQPHHERGAIKFPGTKIELLTGAYSELAYQMIQFPNAAHDDILDSLAYHLPLIRAGGVVKKTELPHHSPAWIENEMYEQEIQHMGKRPRRARERISSKAFS